jgi:hypothetical protein
MKLWPSKRVLVGITYVTSRDELIEQRQFHGVIEAGSAEAGVAIRLPDGSAFRLPLTARPARHSAGGRWCVSTARDG